MYNTLTSYTKAWDGVMIDISERLIFSSLLSYNFSLISSSFSFLPASVSFVAFKHPAAGPGLSLLFPFASLGGSHVRHFIRRISLTATSRYTRLGHFLFVFTNVVGRLYGCDLFDEHGMPLMIDTQLRKDTFSSTHWGVGGQRGKLGRTRRAQISLYEPNFVLVRPAPPGIECQQDC